MNEGDYIIVKDTNPNLAAKVGMGGVTEEEYRQMGPKQLNELRSSFRNITLLITSLQICLAIMVVGTGMHGHHVRRMK